MGVTVNRRSEAENRKKISLAPELVVGGAFPHYLLRAVHDSTVLRRPHRTDRDTWVITVLDGDYPATEATRVVLTAFTAAGLVTWLPSTARWTATGTERAFTTTLGNEALWRWDTELGLIAGVRDQVAPSGMSKVYLAARYSRNEEMRGVRAVLMALGCEVTSRWIDCHGGKYPGSFTCEQLNDDPGYCAAVGRNDVEDLAAADTVVSFTSPGGGGKGGRHVACGLALGLGKRLILVGPRENVFHTLPQVQWYPDWPSLVMALVPPLGAREATIRARKKAPVVAAAGVGAKNLIRSER
jgi:hypothetical protein